MPPKAKFTKEEITAKALEIVREKGESALTARSLGDALGSSARPIFTVFESMDEVQKEVFSAATELYNGYVRKGLSETPAFKGVGQAYIRFAADEPKLFQLLFMRENESMPDKNSVLPLIDGNSEAILGSIENGYGLSRELSESLYLHLWIYSHGIAVLIATKVCVMSEKEVSDMLTVIFTGLLKKIKSEGRL